MTWKYNPIIISYYPIIRYLNYFPMTAHDSCFPVGYRLGFQPLQTLREAVKALRFLGTEKTGGFHVVI